MRRAKALFQRLDALVFAMVLRRTDTQFRSCQNTFVVENDYLRIERLFGNRRLNQDQYYQQLEYLMQWQCTLA